MKKIILIGTGQMAQIYADLICERNDAEICAVVGNSQKTVTNLSLKCKGQAFSDGDLAGALVKFPEAEGIILATPEWVRGEYLALMASSKKKLLIEKPLVTNVTDLRFFLENSNGSTENVSVVHSLRLSPRFSQAKLMQSQGEIGELRHIYSRRNPSLKSVQRVLGKFPLVYWMACHDIDLMRWFAESEVEYVYVATRNKLQSADDYLLAHLHFKNGVDAIQEVSWCSPPVSSLAPTCLFHIKGTEGLLEINDHETNVNIFKGDERVFAPDTYEHFPIGGNHYGIFHQVIDTWLKTSNGAQKEWLNYDNARKSIEVCEAMERAIQTGGRVYLNA